MADDTHISVPGVELRGSWGPRYEEVLNDETVAFLAALQRKFNPTRLRLLRRREARQQELDAGALPDFLPETQADPRRRLDGRADPRRPPRPPRRDHRPGRPQDDRQRPQFRREGLHGRFRGRHLADLGQHRSRARSTSRTAGQGTIDFTDPQSGKDYKLGAKPGGPARPPARLAPARGAPRRRRRADVRLAVRFRPLLLPQRQGRARRGQRARISTCPRWRAISRRGSGTRSSSTPRRRSACRIGTIKATVLIETLPAAFEMDEILYELRDHMAGLNCGRWDYIFSFIKTLARTSPTSSCPTAARW